MVKNERQLRREIFNKVIEFCKAGYRENKFIPGTTPIPYGGRVYDDKEIVNLVDAALDFWLTADSYARKFEEKLAAFLGIKYCLLTNSGSSANLLALSALTSPSLKEKRLKPKDEVIIASCGFPTTLNPIIQNGLTPVFVDIDIATYNIQASLIERAISKKTKAVLVTHTLGNPADMDEILRVVNKHRLWLIEDNCDALGSKYRGRYTGAFGHISTCSFYASHMITTGEGGAVLTDDPLLRRLIISFRDWGRDCWCEPGHDNTCKKRFLRKFGKLPFGYDHKFVYSHIGYNLKITDLQAAIGVAQLEKLKGFIRRRQENFETLYRGLEKYKEYFVLPEAAKHSHPCWFGFPVLIKENRRFNRADIVNFLEENKIATRMLFGGNLAKQPAYSRVKYRIAGDLKNTDLVLNNLFWIGLYPGIGPAQLKYMIAKFGEFILRRRKTAPFRARIECAAQYLSNEQTSAFKPRCVELIKKKGL